MALALRRPYVCFTCELRQSLRASSRRGFRPSSILCEQNSPTTSEHVQLAFAGSPNGGLVVRSARHVRDNPQVYARNCIERNYGHACTYPEKIVELFAERHSLLLSIQDKSNRIKMLETELRLLKKRAKEESPDDPIPQNDRDLKSFVAQQRPDQREQEVRIEARAVREDVGPLQKRDAELQGEIHRCNDALPNLTSSLSPRGEEPRLIEYLNHDSKSLPRSWPSNFSHVDIGTTLELIDLTSSTASTGWGWYYLTNEAALLEQALVQYALNVAIRRGWKPVSPPSIAYSHIVNACGFQPRDQNNEQQIWNIEQSEKDRGKKPPRSLAATAEIPLAAMHAMKTIKPENLPLKVVGSSRCYRAEAGARGIGTKGLYRVHEFTKVEMFAWTDAAQINLESEEWTAQATAVFNEMIDVQKEILGSLGLPCRMLEMPSTDLGASAYRKIDIEALFPSRAEIDGGWGEVTSASICTDYQSTRLATKIEGRAKQPKTGPVLSTHPHTVNGTALAIPRVLAAILENGWDHERQSVTIPKVLWPWMGGITEIIKKK